MRKVGGSLLAQDYHAAGHAGHVDDVGVVRASADARGGLEGRVGDEGAEEVQDARGENAR